MDMQTAILVITSWVIKPLLMLALLSVLWLLLARQSAAFKHFVLSLGLLGLLLIPILGFFLPALDWHAVPLIGNLALGLDAWLNQLFENSAANFSLDQGLIVLGIYLLGFSWIIYFRLLGYGALLLQSRRAQQIADPEFLELKNQLCELLDIQRPLLIKSSRAVDSPQMWGFWQPEILLPREAVLWDVDKKLAVLMHELGHVSRRDWLMSQLVNLTCAVFWFLPPVWWLANRVYDQAEIACDDLIHRLRNKHLAYAQSLMQLAGAENTQEEASLGMSGKSAIFYRIAAVLDKQRPRAPVALEAAQYWVIVGGLLLAFMASIQIIPLKPVHAKALMDWVTLDLDEWKRKNQIEQAPVVPVENFDWQSLPRMSAQRPAQNLRIEEVKVTVPRIESERPNLQVQPLNLSEKISPQIQVQGYLPLEIVTPQYPSSALAKGLEGNVTVEFTILADGSISDAKILRSDAAVFNKAVLAAIKKSRYQPQMFDGQPVVLQGVTEDFTFQIQNPPRRR